MNIEKERYNYLRQFHPIDKNDFDLLNSQLKSKSFKKGQFITSPDQIQKDLYFVRSGVQMSYFDTIDKSHVIAFTYSPSLCAIPESFSFQTPSKYYLTCLSDSEMDFITYDALQQLFDQSHALERLFRKMSEGLLAGVINRHMELQALSMEERFKAFCKRSPHLLQMVPHKHIASYLGIDSTNFSKLFNHVKI